MALGGAGGMEGDTNGDRVGGETDIPFDRNMAAILPINPVGVCAVSIVAHPVTRRMKW